MFNRFVIYIFSISNVFAGIPCTQNIDISKNNNLESLVKLAPDYCVKKYQNFEFENGIDDFCKCQLDQKDNIKPKSFVSEDEKLKEVGEVILSEIFELATQVSYVSNEVSIDEVESLGLSFPSSCNLPSFLSVQNLSCNGKPISNKILSSVFTSLIDNVDANLIEDFGIEKSKNFSSSLLTKNIEKYVKVMEGEEKVPGRGKSCLPPSYNSDLKKTYHVNEPAILAYFDGNQKKNMKELFESGVPENRKKVLSSFLSKFEDQCSNLKNNINEILCNNPQSLSKKVSVADIENSMFEIDLGNVAKLEDGIGRLKEACFQKDLKDVPKHSFEEKVYKKVVTVKDIDYTSKSKLASSIKNGLKYTNNFNENICSQICLDASPYEKSGCQLKNVEELDAKFCTDSSAITEQEQKIVCSIVEVERYKNSKIEIEKTLANFSDDEAKEYVEKHFEGDKKGMILKIVQAGKIEKKETTLKSLFFSEQKGAKAVVGKITDKNSDDVVIAKINVKKSDDEVRENTNKRESSSSEHFAKNDDSQMVVKSNQYNAQGPLSSFGMTASTKKVGGTDKSLGDSLDKISSRKKNDKVISDLQNKSDKKIAQRLGQLSDRLSQSQNRINSLYDDLQGKQVSSDSLASRMPSSSGQYANHNQLNRGRNLVGNSNAIVTSTLPTNSNSFDNNTDVNAASSLGPTDLVGRGVTGVSSTDDRSYSVNPKTNGAFNKLSNISKLFMGEYDKNSIDLNSNNSELKKIRIPNNLEKIDLVSLLQNRDEIMPGDPFILFEIENGKRIEVTLVPTFVEYRNKRSFQGYKAININKHNEELVRKIKAHKNLIRD